MPDDQDLDHAIEAIVDDAYGADEQHNAVLAVIEDETHQPTAATLLDTPVTVASTDYTNEAPWPTCQGPDDTGEVALAGLTFPPDTVTARIHTTYRRHLSLTPLPARFRSEWAWAST
ncbi:hypothetical protein C1A38_02380 [Verrucosispora sp. ts21]|uniref:hypothetical protein n=1 Tax=Verrucosispora sp. ts21 TaxID=2069341 RepID=UPI000C88A280|nr:hypothetical protein [Verrucosispora sp. ts21]PMR62622.1 hypothetical protein C1A38_02380 [Verrucosispora sp. ts21]